MQSREKRNQWALLAPVAIFGLLILTGMPVAAVHADSKYAAGTHEAEDALDFDPYNVDAYAAEMDLAMPDDPPLPIPFSGGGGSPPTGDAYLSPTQLFIPFRPPPASPVR